MNWQTALIAAVVAGVFLSIVICELRKKKQGKSSCSCGSCGSCPMSGSCHSDQK